jgi:hypothetical protein
MSFETGSVIGGNSSGESAPDSAIKSDSGNQSGRSDGPVIIGGYESEDPRTERIAGDRGDGGNGPKLTKSGRIDGRTLRGKRTSETAAQKPGAIGFSQLDLTEVIFSMHQMLAGITSVPELELDRGESEKLGSAIKDVGSYYGAVFDPKKVAIFNLCMVAGGIYGTRLFAIRNRIALQKAAKPPIPKATPINTRTQASEPIANGSGVAKPRENGIPFEVLGFGNGDAAL